ncbi:MAG: GYD domain-containing protein [Actinomycetota bacterium]
MARYLWQVSYTHEGVKGLAKEGGTGRRKAVEKVVGGLGGSLEAFYFAFGDDDVYCIVDLPDNVSAASVSITVGAAGAARVKTVVLLTPEEIDEATKRSMDYRAPGA